MLISIPLLNAAEIQPLDPNALKSLEPTATDIYLKKLDKKFDKAALNFVAGWTELIRQPKLEWQKEQSKTLKVAKGMGQGIVFAVTDTVVGFFNAVTSIFPQFEIPLPQGGVQVAGVTGGTPVGAETPEKDEDEL